MQKVAFMIFKMNPIIIKLLIILLFKEKIKVASLTLLINFYLKHFTIKSQDQAKSVSNNSV